MNYHQHYLHCSFCQKFGHHSIIFLWQALFLRDKNNALGTWANPSSSFLEKKIIFNSPLMKYDFMSKYQRIIQILFLRSTKTLEKIISFYLSEIEIFIQCSSLSWKILSFISSLIRYINLFLIIDETYFEIQSTKSLIILISFSSLEKCNNLL